MQALRMVGDFITRAVEDTSDDEARSNMILASAYAGIGFGNAGVHLPHGMSYPVSGMVKGRGWSQAGYPNAPEMIPHGFSVILNAPAVFRFTAGACPQRHLDAAAALGVDTSNAALADAGKILADRIIAIMERLKVPSGLKALGYTSSDIPALVEGTLPQHRVTKLSPRPANTDDLAKLFEETLQVY
jgi:hydroxyacid-oxoacid transhydrogenase